MEWIYIGVILNTVLTAGFPDEEKCLGHKAIMERDHKIAGTCVKAPGSVTGIFSGNVITVPNGCSLVYSDGRAAC